MTSQDLRRGKKKSFAESARHTCFSVWKHRQIYVILFLPVLWYIIFAYIPMAGLQLAFKDYKANLGIWGSPWNGLENYQYVMRDPAFFKAIGRTLSINLLRLVFVFPFPVMFAIMLNEIRFPRYRKFLQTVMTFPNFLSWVIVSSILINILSFDGMVNGLLSLIGLETVNFLGSEKLFQPLLYMTDVWKSSGWNTIIYLAAITGIDQSQYEAAEVDGASRWQRIVNITLPNLLPTIIIMFILTTGNLMSAGVDQIFNLNNSAVKEVAETLDMYIYRITFQSAPDFGFSTAVSLFRSIVNMILLVLADRGSKAMGGNGLFA